jgi:hypothetical protein
MQPARRLLAFTFPHRAYSNDRLAGYLLARMLIRHEIRQNEEQ